jgi:hypothetical protein
MHAKGERALTWWNPAVQMSHLSLPPYSSFPAELVSVLLLAFIHSFIQYSVWLTTGPKPLPKRFLRTVRSRASSFKWEYPLPSIRTSSSFLRFLPQLLVSSISPFLFPSITCFRKQFLRKMWRIQLAFRFRIFLVLSMFKLVAMLSQCLCSESPYLLINICYMNVTLYMAFVIICGFT